MQDLILKKIDNYLTFRNLRFRDLEIEFGIQGFVIQFEDIDTHAQMI